MACDSLATGYYVSSIVHLSFLKHLHPGCVSESRGMQRRMHKPLGYKKHCLRENNIFPGFFVDIHWLLHNLSADCGFAQ